MLMIVLDATVVNVALPAIQSDLGFPHAAALTGGYRLAFLIAAALVLAAIAVAVTVLRPDRQAAEEQGPEDECDCCPEAA
jgi:MFS family permease